MSWLGSSISSLTKEISNIGAYTKEILRETREEETDHVAELAVSNERIKELEVLLGVNKAELERISKQNAELLERSHAADLHLAATVQEHRAALLEKDKEINRLRLDLEGGAHDLTPKESDLTHHRTSSKGSSTSWTDAGDIDNFVQELEGKLRDEVEGRQQDVAALQDFYKSKLANICKDYETQIRKLNEGLQDSTRSTQAPTCAPDVDASFTNVCTWDEIDKFKDDLSSFLRALVPNLSQQQRRSLGSVLDDYNTGNPDVWGQVHCEVAELLGSPDGALPEEEDQLSAEVSLGVVAPLRVARLRPQAVRGGHQQDVEELREKILTLVEENTKLAETLNEIDNRESAERARQNAALERLKNENAELQRGIEQLDEEHELAVGQLLADKDKLQSEVSGLRADVDNNTCRIQDLEEENEFLKLENRELRRGEASEPELPGEDTERELRGILGVQEEADVMALLKEKMKELSELQWKTETLEKKLVECSSDVKTFKEAVRDLREEKLELERECCELKDKLQQLSEELELALERQGRLETIEENEEDRDALNQQMSVLEGELAAALRTIEGYEAQLNDSHGRALGAVMDVFRSVSLSFPGLVVDRDQLANLGPADWSSLQGCVTVPDTACRGDRGVQACLDEAGSEELREERDGLLGEIKDRELRIQLLERQNSELRGCLTAAEEGEFDEANHPASRLQLSPEDRLALIQLFRQSHRETCRLHKQIGVLVNILGALRSRELTPASVEGNKVDNLIAQCNLLRGESEGEIQRLQVTNTSLISRITEVEHECRRSAEDVEIKQRQISALQQVIEALEEAASREELAKQERLQLAAEQSDEVSCSISEKDGVIRQLQESLSDMQKLLQNKETEVERLKRELAQVQESMDQLRGDVPKKSILEQKLRAKDQQLQSKTEEFRRILESKEEEMVAANQKVTTLQDQNNKLIQDLQRLQAHIIDLNRYYDDQIVQMEKREEELRQSLNDANQKVAASSAVYSSANEQTLSKLQALEQQYQTVCGERDQLVGRVAELQTNNQLNIQSLKNLQIVLDQFEAGRETDLGRLRKEHEDRIEAVLRDCRRLEGKVSRLEDELNSANEGLQAAARLNHQMAAKDSLIRELKAQVSEHSNEISKLKGKLEDVRDGNKGLIDRDVTKNLLVNYLVASGHQKVEIMKIIAHILDFNADDLSRIGLSNHKPSSWLPALLKRTQTHSGSQSPSSSDFNTSFTEAFISFLEEESKLKHKSVMKLPAQDIASEVAGHKGTGSLLFQTPMEFSAPSSSTSSRGSTPLGFTSSLKSMNTSLPVLRPSPVRPEDSTINFLREALEKGDS